MIDPKLLTPENGFEDGMVVEYHYGSVDMDSTSYWVHGNRELLIEQIKGGAITSIRPITGPMSIWNHIPQLINSADYPVIDPENWYTSHIGEVQRPWWSRGTGNE